MPRFTQVSSHRFHVDLPIAWVIEDLERIAVTVGLNLMSWDADGLGQARGAIIIGGRGHAFVLEALGHDNSGDKRVFEIRGDGVDIAAEGLVPLIDEVAECLQLDDTSIVGNTAEIVTLAIELIQANKPSAR